MRKTEICIVGAGPGGAAAALKLAYANQSCMLLDKATFPRDKICGDALSGKVSTVLNRLDPEIMNRFRAQPQVGMWGFKFTSPSGKEMHFDFTPENKEPADYPPAPGYVATRLVFDNFLIEEVKRHDSIDLHEGVQISEYIKTPEGYLLKDKSGKFTVQTKILIVANGAHSAFSRKHAGLEKDNRHHAGGLRVYYKNVANLEGQLAIELHYFKELVPGYLWIFPLPNNGANVGIGMRTDMVSDRKFNMRNTLEEMVATHPRLKDRFKNAEITDSVKGYGLPLGSKKRILSGDNYMLVGDAGHLIDPLTGEGIGNAIYSGTIAADQAVNCLKEEKYDAKFMRDYDVRIQRVLGTELKASYLMQRIMLYPRVVNFLTNRVENNKFVMDFLNKIYADSTTEWHKELWRPSFWWRVIKGN